MIWSIAWRNIWRNKKRSGVLIAAVTFGLWAGLIMVALMMGGVRQMVDSAIQSRTSHIQLNAPGFRDHREIELIIPDSESVLEKAKNSNYVIASSSRTMIKAMVKSPTSSLGVTLYGIDPDDEKTVTDIFQLIVDGTYFDHDIKNPVVIGQKLAEKLGVKVGNKIVFNAQSLDGSIAGGAFRIVGIYKSVYSEYDKATVFALRSDVNGIFGLNSDCHIVAVMVDDIDHIGQVTAELKKENPELEVLTWKDIEPQLAIIADSSNQSMFIFMIIILLALVFGITNTMLMGVLERVREFGVVMALGMKHLRIFIMILIETVMLSLLGGILGFCITALTMAILSKTGIDLSIVSKGLESWGFTSVLYPYLPADQYLTVGILVFFTAILSSVYPGIKAVRLNPVKAIRSI